MCTVTYIPTAAGCFLTSSRDEKAVRAKALAPAIYLHQQQQLLYPKDAAANGSWVAVTETGTAAVLLNGAFEKHQPKPVYRKSRGLVPITAFRQVDLEEIEPFTLILFCAEQLFECRWDGQQKHILEMDTSARHIWSSATLYTPEKVEERKSWFNDWCAKNPSPTQPAIVGFHKFAGNGNCENSICMNRNNSMLTVSITSIHTTKDAASMLYYDLQEKSGFSQRHLGFHQLATN